MITSFIQGGLGNQMFQIAAGYALSKELMDDFVLMDNQHYLPLQGNKISTYKDNIFKQIKFTPVENIKPYSIYKEPHYHFSNIPPHRGNLVLEGYFQSEKYFSKYKESIRDLYKMTPQEFSLIKTSISSLSKECVSIHLRFGDYLKFPDTHPIVSKKYIRDALDLIGKVDKVLCFSDDISKVGEYIPVPYEVISLGIDHLDLYAMSCCQHNIIANSSFSWWGAWLNNNQSKKIVAPKIWFGPKGPQDWQDIYCPDWNVI